MIANETPRRSEGIGDQPASRSNPDTTADREHAAEFFRECFAVLVRGKTVRRHLYLNLPAATRTVARARNRGDNAEMVLVKLVPVDARHFDGGDAL